MSKEDIAEEFGIDKDKLTEIEDKDDLEEFTKEELTEKQQSLRKIDNKIQEEFGE